jgi:light-regulated signal transduction histidine kinase (bacteriophytochrome)
MIDIFVVEDETIVAEAIMSKLRKAGYNVVGTADCGDEAIKKVGKLYPDIVLMDIHLAGDMDGIDTALVIRETHHIPVIFLTAYADGETLERAKRASPFGYLVKPFRERDMRVTIEMALMRSRLEDELEAANRELDLFSYSVSHDLRSPLIMIEGFSRLLIEDHYDSLDEYGKECVLRIREAVEHMDQLIHDFLRLARISKDHLDVGPVSLSDIAEKILTKYALAEPERCVTWEVTPNLNAKGDPHLLEICLENLLGNAWKYTLKEEDASIEFNSLAHGLQTVYFIRDNGAGFSMDKAKNIFTPLQRLHTQDEFPGTGLGLSTVQRIIRRHGGKIWFEAGVDKGATFYFTLPSPP